MDTVQKQNGDTISEWKGIFEDRPSSTIGPDGRMFYKVHGVRRSDGMTVTREGMDREKRERFLCKGSFGEFKFLATRWNSENNQPSEKYTVHVKSYRAFQITQRDTALCKLYAKDIESALLVLESSLVGLTVFSWYNHIAAKEVIFDIDNDWTRHHYVKAEEI